MKSLDHSHPHGVSLRILVEDLADTRTIRPAGPLDTGTAPELLKVLRQALIRRPTILAADLSDVEFLGVAGLEVLLRMRRVAGRGGTAFVLTGDPRPEVARLLGIFGLGVTTLPRHITSASALGRPATRAAGGRVRRSHGPRGSAPMRAVPS
jgi:anti-anti-sigma factor